MRKFAFGALGAVTAGFVFQGALACAPAAGAVFDDAHHPSVTAFTGRIASIAAVPSGRRGSCLTIKYHIEELAHGDGGDELHVMDCSEDVSVEQMNRSLAGMGASLGMKVGAYVFAATTLEGVQGATPRLLAPNCWGFWHYRIGDLTDQSRRKFIDRQRRLFSQAK